MSWVPNAPTGLSVLPAFVNTPTISTSSLPSGEAGLAYSFQLLGTGGTQPYTWSASGLPAGMSCSASGMLSGTPSASFSGNVTINLSDATSATAPPRILPLTIIAGPVVSTSSLPTANVGSGYSFQMTATGGTPGYTWMASGLPSGLGCSSSGLITGTPTATGTPTVVFTATDSVGVASPNKSLTLTVNAASSGLFIPDAGYTYSGSVAWDTSGFTITKTGGGFGATGPITLMATDFRSGTPGNAVAAGTAGYAGSATWSNGGGTFGYQGNPVYVASGNGPGNFIRIRSNGDADTSYEGLTLNFANITDIYMCWGENSNGVDYNNIISNGGNNFNYKQTWVTFNGHTAGAFNMVCPIVQLATAGVAGSNILVNSNDGIKSGGPLPDWFVSGAGGWYDPNHWNTVEVEYSGDPSNPTTGTNTTESLAVYSSANAQKVLTAANPGGSNPNTNVLFNSGSGAQGTYSVANGVFFPGLLQGFPATAVIYRSDAYFSVGKQRFVVGDQPTIAACTTLVPCTIDQGSASPGTPAGGWTDASVSMTPRRGSRGFPATLQNSGLHLYVRTASAAYAHVGQFGNPIVFKFFISPTGNDANNGLTPATAWAITSLRKGSGITSPNFALIDGQGVNVGFMPGTYDCSGLMINDALSGALQFPGGTSATPNIYGSCDANGNYSPRTATFDGKGATGLFGGHHSTGAGIWDGPIISHVGLGVGSQSYTLGYCIIDGLRVTGFSYKGIRIGAASFGGPATITTPVIVRNCEFTGGGFNSGDAGDNCAALWLDRNVNAITATNNWFHDSVGPTLNSGDHFNAIILWGGGGNSAGTIITNNTCVKAGNIFGKEGGVQGTVITNNYVDVSNLTAAESMGIQDFTGNTGTAAGTLTTTIANNIVIGWGANAPNTWDSLGGVSTDSQNTLAWRTPVNIFNNTVVNMSTSFGLIVGELDCNSGENGVGKVQFYNNIYWNKGGGTGSLNGNGNFRANPQSLQVMDYNLVPASGITYAIASNSAPATTVSTQTSPSTFATAYAAAGGISGVEAHTLTGAPTFVLTGIYAAQYQLANGSLGKGAGSSNGTTGGTATDMGAWGNGATQIGCNFAT